MTATSSSAPSMKPAHRRATTRQASRSTPSRPDSRARLLASAGVEFADHGFRGASVDRIAHRARANKALIYYYFGNKTGLYREVLRETYRAVSTRVNALGDELTPEEALRAFIATILDEVSRRPYFPRFVMHELADRGRRIDAETIATMAEIPLALTRIISRGVEEGLFARVNPFLVFFSIIGPLVVFHGSMPIRSRLPNGPLRASVDISLEDLTAHVQRSVLALLGTPASAVSESHSSRRRS